MKLKYFVLSFILFFLLLTPKAMAGTFSDDFNDGDTNGWLSETSCNACGYGNWRVEDGILIENNGGSNYNFLVEEYNLTNQTIEVETFILPNGGAGFSIWHEDIDNWVEVSLAPTIGAFRIIEFIDGVQNIYDYPLPDYVDKWYDFKAQANSLSGEIYIYLDDELRAIHEANTTHRSGLSGLVSGNGGSRFDNFKLISDSIVNLPSTKEDCKNDGWKNFEFKNQGKCVSFVASGGKTLPIKPSKQPKLVDTVVVDPTNYIPTFSNISLDFGKKYIFEVSGSYTNRNGSEQIDAEYMSEDNWLTKSDGLSGWPLNDYWNELDLMVNNEFVDWLELNPSVLNTYNFEFTGMGNPVNFMVFDGSPDIKVINPAWYSDNLGGLLTVKIYKTK